MSPEKNSVHTLSSYGEVQVTRGPTQQVPMVYFNYEEEHGELATAVVHIETFNEMVENG